MGEDLFRAGNTPATISGDTTGAVTEDDNDRQQAAGVITVTDPDEGEDRFRDPEAGSLQGTFGSFAFDPISGAWSYTLDNDSGAVQSLPEGVEVTDSLTVTSLDGTASETITVTVTGVNDPASISGDTTGAVTEDDPARQQASGVITVTDPDAGEDRFREPEADALQGSYGSFAFDADTGAWSYTLDNDADAVQALPEGVEVTDSLTVTSFDGTASETITVTVTGTGVREISPPEPGDTVILSGQVLDRAGNELSGTSVTFTVSATAWPYAARLDGWLKRHGMRSSMPLCGWLSRMARRVAAM